jgi:hypothetical protein
MRRMTMRRMTKVDVALVAGMALLLVALLFAAFGLGLVANGRIETISCPVGRVTNPPEQCRNNGNPAMQ